MSEEPRTAQAGWTGSWDFPRIFRAARMALGPSKLGLALTALVLTYGWTGILDGIWKSADRGVAASALRNYLPGEGTDAKGDTGIAALWRDEALQALRESATAVVSLDWTGPGSLVASVGMICRATGWLISRHWFFALLLLGGTLAIWAYLGGAICRIAAVECARDEKVGVKPALAFAREKFVSGFFIAPLLPLLIMGVAGLLLALGGAMLSIPAVGNLFALLFPLALVGGAAIAFMIIGAFGGGWLFWPTVAVEGSDGFDAISRSFSYFFGRPAKSFFYALVTCVWGGICWTVLHLAIWLAMRATHACLGFGAGGLGTGWWGMRPSIGEGATKLDTLWRSPQLGDLYSAGNWAQLGWWDKFPTLLIGLWAILAVGVLWAFLASYFFCGSTIVYYVLRHSVDATDYDDVYVEDDGADAPARAPAQRTGAGMSLPVVQASGPNPSAIAPPAE